MRTRRSDRAPGRHERPSASHTSQARWSCSCGETVNGYAGSPGCAKAGSGEPCTRQPASGPRTAGPRSSRCRCSHTTAPRGDGCNVPGRANSATVAILEHHPARRAPARRPLGGTRAHRELLAEGLCQPRARPRLLLASERGWLDLPGNRSNGWIHPPPGFTLLPLGPRRRRPSAKD